MATLVHSSSVVAPSARLCPPSYVGPHCIIGFRGFQHPESEPEEFAKFHRVTSFGEGARLVGLTFVGCGTSVGVHFQSRHPLLCR